VAIARGLVPLIYGDVALDDSRGGTIVSTEDLFVYLAGHLRPSRILLVGEVDGVLDASGEVIPRMTPRTFASIAPPISGSAGVDVTGGMLDKVARMVDLVDVHRGAEVHVLSGLRPGLLFTALCDRTVQTGTRIVAD
jgi:isopentenyl phosphate kinase